MFSSVIKVKRKKKGRSKERFGEHGVGYYTVVREMEKQMKVGGAMSKSFGKVRS